MRMGGATMLRTTTTICALALAALLLPAEAMAAGPQGGRGPGGPSPMRASSSSHRPVVGHLAAERHVVPQSHGYRHGRSPGRRFIGAGGYLGPAVFPFDAGAGAVIRRERREPVDHNAFEHMPVRIGIPPAPTPEPTLYRIEGSRDRPIARVIRIGTAEPRDGVRSRYAHAETGALLLTVPAARARR